MPAEHVVAGSAARPGIRDEVIVGIIIVAGAVLRALMAGAVPLHPDEMYYWHWSRRLALGYLDHPPLIAYLVFLATRLGDGQMWIRLPALLSGLATPYVVFLFARDLFGRRAALLAVVLYSVVPMIWLAGVMIFPDSPLQVLWLLALRMIWQGLHGRPGQWTWAGLVLGVGLLTKLHTLLLGAGVFIFLALYERPWLRRVEPYRAAVLAGLFLLPVIYWNATHDWAGLRFMLFYRPKAFSPREGIDWIVTAQVNLVMLLLPAFLWALWTVWRRRGDERMGFIFWTSVPALIFTVVSSPVGAARGHWLSPIYLVLAPVLGMLWNRAIAGLTAGTAFLVAVGVALTLVPALPPLPGAEFLYGFDEAIAQVRRAAASMGEGTVIVSDYYEIAAHVGYYTGDATPVLVVPPIPGSVWADPERFRGGPALGVTYGRSRFDWTRCAVRVEELPPAGSTFRSRPMVTLRVLRLHGLSPECAARRP